MSIQRFFASLVILAVLALPARAEEIRIGTVKLATAGSLFIAQEKGYFAAEGLDAKFTWLESPGAVIQALAAGDLDVGTTGSSAAIYALGGQGAIKIIAAQGHEAPGFRINGFVVSNKAWDAGLKTYRDLAGHSIGVAQIGGPTQYAAALVLAKYGIALNAVRFVALQSNPNVQSAVTGGTADTGVIPAIGIVPAVEHGAFKVLGWIGDEAPWQSSAVIVSTATANAKAGLINHFLAAYRKAGREYHDAFAAADGTRRDGPNAAEVLAIFSKYTGQSEAQLRLGISYVDPEARIDFADVRRQIAWFKSQGMLKPEVEANQILDTRYAVPIPGTN